MELSLDGGLPLPELADMNFTVQSLSNAECKDLICAFEAYHQVKFPYHNLNCDEDGTWLYSYETQP